jgi:hypothetical protein
MNRFIMTLVGLACWTGMGTAAPPVEADPNKEYVITPAAGPWMIRAAVYEGADSKQKAHELVLEIRSRYNLPAYVFYYGEEERRKQREELERLRQQYKDNFVPPRTTRIPDQSAVLVGGYRTMDEARDTLQKIKKLQPSSDRLKTLFTDVRSPEDKEKEDDVIRAAEISPFLTSFVVPNPTVPVKREPRNEYALYKKLNEYESYNVLQCKKPWTMAVAKFQGLQTFQPKNTSGSFMDKLWGRKSSEHLDACSLNAHNLAEALRQQGFEAYVLHARWGSVVTVGGFDGPDDPRMRQVEQAIASRLQIRVSNAPATAQSYSPEEMIGMMPRPWPPMPVPRP